MFRDRLAKLARPRRKWVPYFVLAIMLLLTGVASYYAAAAARAKDLLRFQNAVHRTRDDVKDRLETYVAMLRAGTGLFAADDNVSREEFRAFVERLELETRYRGIQGIGFAVRVLPEEEQQFVEAVRREGLADFAIRSDGPGDVRFVILYLEPLDRRNRAALGYDMFSEPVRREAMSRARDTGAPAASGRVTLVQELDERKQAGFLIYVPVYRGGARLTTPEERAEAITGFVYSPFRADDLLNGIFSEGERPSVGFQVYDGEAVVPENLMHASAHPSATGENFVPQFTATTKFDVAGHAWTIAFASSRDFEAASGRSMVPYVFVGGLALSFVLFIVTLAQARAREESELAAERLMTSETRFRTVVEQSPLSMQIFSPDGNTQMVNGAWEQLWGVKLEELGGYNVLEDRQLEEKGIMPYVRRGFAGEPTAIPPVLYDPNETIPDVTKHADPVRWVQAFIYPVKGERGEIREVVLIHEDITEQKRLEDEIRAHSEVVETINRVGRVLSAELDPQKLVQSLTDAATELCGARFGSFFYNVLDAEGGSYLLYTLSGVPREAFEHFPMPRTTDLFGPTFRGEGTVRIDDVKLDPRYGRNSPYFGLPEGHLPVTSYLAVPVISRSGEVLGGLFFGHPEPGVFTARHEQLVEGLAAQAAVAMDNARLFESEQRARREAEEASSLKDEFLATLSHELRTPLTAILGWAKLLRTQKFAQEVAARALDTIERNAVVQAQLVDDLLDVSRIITGKLVLSPQPVEPAAFIEAAVEGARPTARARGVELLTHLDTSAGPVSGDADRLQQVVWNLLSNAIKFTPQGGRVEVRLERADGHARIVVSDTGRGISPNFLPHVFDRFRQADGSITREHGGLGLGLSIVRHLVELHGGTVRAESEGAGRGATFTVDLPLARRTDDAPNEDGGRVEEDARVEEEAFTPPAGYASLAGLHVLVVDDDEDARALLSTLLRRCGARATTVGTAAEALEAFKNLKPDVIVSDIGMPNEDGYELIRKVRELGPEGGGDVPAVALTAYARAEDRERALAFGYQLHVAKPIDPAEFSETLAQLARGRGRS